MKTCTKTSIPENIAVIRQAAGSSPGKAFGSALLLILLVISITAAAYASSRPDLVFRLGGSFTDKWTPDNGNYGWIADYHTSMPDSNDGGMSVLVVECGPSLLFHDVKKRYNDEKNAVMRIASLQPFSAGDEAVWGKRTSNPNYTDYLGRIGRYMVRISTSDYNNRIDEAKYFTAIIAKLSGAASPGKYTDLIAVLKKYKPLLFRDISDDIIVKALDQKRTSLAGEGPTIKLEQMTKDIQDFNRMLDAPLAGSSNSLVSTDCRTDTFRDRLWDTINDLKELLPEMASRMIGVVDFFRKAHRHMTTIRDSYLIPAFAEDIYAVYKSHRGPGKDQTPDIVYDSWVQKMGSKIGPVRSSGYYRDMSEAEFTKVFGDHLEARYQLELYEETRREMLQNREKLIQQIVNGYDGKINSVHSACESLMK